MLDTPSPVQPADVAEPQIVPALADFRRAELSGDRHIHAMGHDSGRVTGPMFTLEIGTSTTRSNFHLTIADVFACRDFLDKLIRDATLALPAREPD